MIIAYQPGFYLQARPDLSLFWFPIGSRRELAIYIEFTPESDSSSSISIEHFRPFKDVGSPSLSDQDVDALIFGVLIAVEAYTGLYPNKYVAFDPKDPICSMIFRVMLRTYRDILQKAFSITLLGEADAIYGASNGETICPAFSLKRTSGAPTVQIDQSKEKYTLRSLLFDFPLTIFALVQVQTKTNIL